MRKNAFILLAAGIGSRFKNKIPKQYIKIGKFNLIQYILNKIILNQKINSIIIVYNKKNPNDLKKSLSIYKTKKIQIVEGGKNRQDSSFKGLKKLRNKNLKKVIIHDACRPYIKNTHINKMLDNLDKYDGCSFAIKNVDLIRIKQNKKISQIYNDSFSTQTPQGFKYEKIFKIHKITLLKNQRDDIE